MKVVSAMATILIAVALLLVGCGGGSSSSATGSGSGSAGPVTTVPRPPGTPPGVRLVGSLRLHAGFRPGAAIPRLYTCDDRDISPPVSWSGVPPGARELVLVMRDPNAPTANFVHWALAGIVPSAGGLAPGDASGHDTPGRNSFGGLGYRGPCPPRGSPAHHYVLTLSALAGPSGLRAGFSSDQLRARALAIATLVGTYKRR